MTKWKKPAVIKPDFTAKLLEDFFNNLLDAAIPRLTKNLQ